MKKKLVYLFPVLLAFGCMSNKDQDNNQSETHKAVMDLKVTDAEITEFPIKFCMSVSPNGRYMFYAEDEFVAWDIEEERIVFSEEYGHFISAYNIRWADDNMKAAFYDFWAMAIDPDIRVADFTRNELSNLTDDGYQFLSSKSTDFFIDSSPVWKSDNKTIYFFRLYKDPDYTSHNELCEISIDRKEVRVICELMESRRILIDSRPMLTDNCKEIIIPVSLDIENESADACVILSIYLSCKKSEIIFDSRDQDYSFYYDFIGMSSDEEKILVIDRKAAREQTENQPLLYIIDLKENEIRPLIDIDGFFDPGTAALSPDKTRILYFYRELPDRNLVLGLYDFKTGQKKTLLKPDWNIPDRLVLNYDLQLSWCIGDIVYGTAVLENGDRRLLKFRLTKE